MEERSIGERFHHETSLSWSRALSDLFTSKPPPPLLFKTFPGAKTIKLPPAELGGVTVARAIQRRRSVRNYSGRPMTLQQLSQLAWTTQGVTGRIYDKPLRTAPSAGALYPFEVYVIVNNVSGLDQGIYHYGVREHHLEQVKIGDFRSRITEAGLDQDMLGEANVTFALSAIFDRCRHKYGERGFRYTYIEAGHISQNIYLQATSMGLGSVAVGAFLDQEIDQLLGLDGRDEAAIYLHAVGTT